MEKLYYKISEVSEMLGITQTRLRHWENTFPKQVNPKRTPGGTRLYKASDIENLKKILQIRKENRLTVRGTRERLNRHRTEQERRDQACDKLRKIRQELVNIRHELNMPEALANTVIL